MFARLVLGLGCIVLMALNFVSKCMYLCPIQYEYHNVRYVSEMPYLKSYEIISCIIIHILKNEVV